MTLDQIKGAVFIAVMMCTTALVIFLVSHKRKG
jgi:hypothetical protein